MNKTLLVGTLAFAYFAAATASIVLDGISFAETPIMVLNSTNDVLNFKHPFVSRYINSTYVGLWGFYADSTIAPFTYNAYLRLLNASNMWPVGNDTELTLNVSLYSSPVFASSTDGYVAFAGVTQEVVGTINTTDSNLTNTTTNVTSTYITVTIFSSDLTSDDDFENLTFGGSTNTSLNYTIYRMWYDDDYFYILYSETINSVDNDLYLVGFNSKGHTKFSYPLKLNTVTLSGNSYAKINSDDDTLIACWRQSTQAQVVYVEVDLDTSIVGDETVIATDTSTDEFTPAAVIFSDDYYVLLMTQTTNGVAIGLTMSVSGSNETTSLNFTVDSGYNSFTISGFGPYYDGWFMTTRQSNITDSIIYYTEETINSFNYSSVNVTTNITEKVNETNLLLLNNGSIVQGFTLQDQSYHTLVVNGYLGASGTWTKAYIGEVFAEISDDDDTFGFALKSVASLAMAVATLLFAL